MPGRPRLLIANYDAGIRRLIRRHFGALGFQVIAVDSGRALIDQITKTSPDVSILSVDIGGPDPLAFVRGVHSMSKAPIIVLLQPKGPVAPVDILDAGADDCLDEPFLLEELAARTRRLLHRTGVWLGPRTVTTVLGRLEINGLERSTRLNGEAIMLTRKEFDLLSALAGGDGATLSHEAIQRKVWGDTDSDGRQNLRRLISTLRRKIEPDPNQPVCVLSVRGDGYRLEVRRPS
jgi:two-component system KDP operon response regulator KdpE